MLFVSVDCMGGDSGIAVTVPAALDFLRACPSAGVVLVGKEAEISAALGDEQRQFGERLRIHHASEVVEMHESPQSALKNKKDSSQRVAINLVKTGVAGACVSAGNTGALMATARFVLKMMPDIERPAICTAMPTMTGHVYVLDLGANVDCTPIFLMQFALMGSVLASVLDGVAAPRVGLLNIGEEAIKGNEVVKQTAELLRNSDLNFVGNIEGDGIFKGYADVVVCDGFVGNAVLKAAEGLATMISKSLKEEFLRNFRTKLAAVFARPVLTRFKNKFDHRAYNGAVLLGLQGITVKSHGSADIYGFTQAIIRAYHAAEQQLLQRISQHLRSDLHNEALPETLPANKST